MKTVLTMLYEDYMEDGRMKSIIAALLFFMVSTPALFIFLVTTFVAVQ